MNQNVYLADEASTVAFGLALGDYLKSLPGGGVVFLEGDLGAGKTTLTRGILQAYGHNGAVKSPTYTLVEAYEFSNRSVFHFDLYRLGDPEELEYMGIRDYFERGNLCLIEWPKRGQGYLPVADLTLDLTVTAPGRTVAMSAPAALGQQFITAQAHQ